MAYARFSDSDVYVFDDVGGGWTCCGCALVGNFNTPSRAAMVAHMREHDAASHRTGDVSEALIEETARLGDTEKEP